MKSKYPRVSIGLPVYNGERYLAFAIDSLLAQTFADYELIICDNASTDRTEEICKSYVARDSRIRYYRNDRNIGANRNFNLALDLATSEYFMWAAYDDLREPTCIARCVEALDADSEVVLAYTLVTIIDEDGRPTPERETTTFRTDAPSPHIRFYDLVRFAHRCMQILGVYRVSALAKTPGLGLYTSADFVLLAELGLIGRFAEIPETLVSYRRHERQSIHLDRQARMVWSGSTTEARLSFPQWRLWFELWSCIGRVPLPWSESLRCYLTIARWPFWYPNSRRMCKDVLMATLSLTGAVLRLAHLPKRRKKSKNATI